MGGIEPTNQQYNSALRVLPITAQLDAFLRLDLTVPAEREPINFRPLLRFKERNPTIGSYWYAFNFTHPTGARCYHWLKTFFHSIYWASGIFLLFITDVKSF